MFKVGDKSKAACEACKKIVSTTIRHGNYSVPGTGETIPYILLAYCDSCGNLVGLPHQSVGDIKKYREKNKCST